MISHVTPQFRRKNIKILDGIWSFAFDKEHLGEEKKYFAGFKKQHDIRVPFSYTCEASGIGNQEHVDTIWYSKILKFSEEDLSSELCLHFEGVDEVATIYLNGHLVGFHRGGNTAFEVLLNQEAKAGENLLVVKVEDDASLSKGRGKQRWLPHVYGCWYIPTYGIYRSVYLEKRSHTHLLSCKLSPKMDEAKLDVDYQLANYHEGLTLTFRILFQGKLIRQVTTSLDEDSGRIALNLNSSKIEYQILFWAPHDPQLYDLEIILSGNGQEIDRIESYFGVAEYKVSGDNVLLNGFSYVSKMVLYQGYTKEGYLTPKDDEEMIQDIKTIKALGFNGIRCHQYIPSERFLYLCDLLGLSVWIEYPSPHLFSLKAQDAIYYEWREILKQKSNHPCVFAYVIYNESWGIRGVKSNPEQQAFVEAMYQLTKAFDPARIVISNDGWEHVKSDIITLHCYLQDAPKAKEFFLGKEHLYCKRDTSVNGFEKEGKPLFLSEYGGCSLGKIDAQNGDWGYGEGAVDHEAFYARFASFAKMMKQVGFKGYCYTQYKDVQQEKNGFVDETGKLKVDPQSIREIIETIF